MHICLFLMPHCDIPSSKMQLQCVNLLDRVCSCVLNRPPHVRIKTLNLTKTRSSTVSIWPTLAGTTAGWWMVEAPPQGSACPTPPPADRDACGTVVEVGGGADGGSAGAGVWQGGGRGNVGLLTALAVRAGWAAWAGWAVAVGQLETPSRCCCRAPPEGWLKLELLAWVAAEGGLLGWR